MRRASVLVCALLVSLSLYADGMKAVRGTSPAQAPDFGQPALVGAKANAPAIATFEAVSENDLETLRQWNDAGNTPMRIGVVRPLEQTFAVAQRNTRTAVESDGSAWRWSGRVAVAEAQQLRLRLTGVSASDATFWVYGNDGQAIGFDASNAVDGVLWTPSVFSDTIHLEVQAPTGSNVKFTVDSVTDIRPESEIVTQGTECFRDLACMNNTQLNELSSGIARYTFSNSEGTYLCTGGLIIDRKQSFEPKFLTANHCVSTQAEAASVEAFWDYRRATCGGAAPSLASRPRSNGAQLLVTNDQTDVTLLRLSSIPGSRVFFGWDADANAVPNGTILSRIAHPSGQVANFTQERVDTASGTCSARPRGRYIYSQLTLGGTAGGSSGSPVWKEGGIIVGQLFGSCGPNLADDCDTRNREVDGALSSSWAVLKPHLDPEVSTGCPACTPNNTTACIIDGRFKVQLNWFTSFGQSLSGTGKIINYTENRPDTHPTFGAMSQNVFFSMYDHAPNAVEVVVRIFRGVSINDKWWAYVTGFSDTGYTVKITDTRTCATWEKTNAHGSFTLHRDTNAFPFP
ncbi:MAG TPA: trypsin-like peptidase domain-containing protein [Thermoanaerobaculia bacterium]